MISKSCFVPILLLLLLTNSSLAILYVQQPTSFNAFCNQCAHDLLGVPTTTAATTSAPEYTTQNAFQRAGWETDDKGNVFVGTDDSKLLLISVGSYWPFPKDYRKK
ncbi:hypothetical protein ANCCAN_27634 [Ancylostoma caninum]|uniref:Uncharacterized protein n=1 Tax=Ancylostoma caninum TaxID=29170 RepID=A0A368F6I0_ANCCA|nr:hypothetical protein ANCCAN_27634 [Ancylostoma caninum]